MCGGILLDQTSIVLKNDRLYLRELNESDWIDVHKYASQTRVSKHQVWGPNTEEESKAFVQQVLADKDKRPRTRYLFAIVINDLDRMIGAGEINIRDTANKSGEIGYIVNPDYWGKGIATDVATLLISFGFDSLNLHRIYAYCSPTNIGSKKVLEKVMSHEGRLRENLLLKEGWRDSLVYSVLEQEWET